MIHFLTSQFQWLIASACVLLFAEAELGIHKYSSGKFKRVSLYCSSSLRSERRLKDRQECSKVGQNDHFKTSFSVKTWHKASLNNIHSKPYDNR